MKKIIRLTESDLVGIVKRIINEEYVDYSQKMEFQPCIKQFFGDKVINSTYQGKTYQSIKGTGDYEGWFFYKGNTAYNPVQNKMINFTCTRNGIILKNQEKSSENTAQKVSDLDTSWDVIKSGEKVIGIGSSGPLVKHLQGTLARLKYGDAKIIGGNENCGEGENVVFCDGKFGKSTKNAVFQFQKQNGLSEDGVFGRQAYQMMYDKRALKTDVKK